MHITSSPVTVRSLAVVTHGSARVSVSQHSCRRSVRSTEDTNGLSDVRTLEDPHVTRDFCEEISGECVLHECSVLCVVAKVIIVVHDILIFNVF